MSRIRKVVLSLIAVLVVAAIAAGWIWKTRGPLLKEIALVVKAGAKARGANKPFERFLEVRYGSMDEPANRQKAFLGFFDPTHIQGMHRLVGYMKEGEKQTNIMATAQWIANYRQTMSAPEKEALAAWLHSTEGRAALQQATGLYRRREVSYRAATEPVIRELMTTLAALQSE